LAKRQIKAPRQGERDVREQLQSEKISKDIELGTYRQRMKKAKGGGCPAYGEYRGRQPKGLAREESARATRADQGVSQGGLNQGTTHSHARYPQANEVELRSGFQESMPLVSAAMPPGLIWHMQCEKFMNHRCS